MQALKLDYQRKYSGLTVKTALLLLLCLGAVVGVAYVHLSESRQVERLERAVQANQLTLQRLSRVTAPPSPRGIEKSIENANVVWLSLNQPWPDLFQALEATKADNVALLAVEPDAAKKTIRIVAEVKKRDVMLKYIEQLEQQPLLKNVVLVEDHINQQDNEKPLRFSLVAEWGNTL
jgi:hypothetical protein